MRCQVVPTRLLRGTLTAHAGASYPSGRLLLPIHPRCFSGAGLGPGSRADARPPSVVAADAARPVLLLMLRLTDKT